jgi:hypothetical protein
MQCLAIHIDDLQASDFRLSEKKTRTWTWKEDGQPKKREQVYAEVYQGASGTNPLIVNLSDIRTINGVQITARYNSGFMSVNLTDELSRQVRERLDEQLFLLCFERRGELLKQGKKITKPSEMKIMFSGLVKDGDEKPDGTGCYNDQITCTVPTQKKGQQVVVDPQQCAVEDLEGAPYPTAGVERKALKEVAIQIEKIVFDKEISVRARYRLIVADTKAVPVVMTKRKLAMQSESPPSGAPAKVARVSEAAHNIEHIELPITA